MKVQSTFYPDFISKAVDILLISPFITKKCPNDWYLIQFTLLIREKNVANYALLQCKIFSWKIWLCKIFDKYHVCLQIWKGVTKHHHPHHWHDSCAICRCLPSTCFKYSSVSTLPNQWRQGCAISIIFHIRHILRFDLPKV